MMWRIDKCLFFLSFFSCVVLSQDAAQLLCSCRKTWKYSNNEVFWGPPDKIKRWKKGTANILLLTVLSALHLTYDYWGFILVFFPNRCDLWSWEICFAQNWKFINAMIWKGQLMEDLQIRTKLKQIPPWKILIFHMNFRWTKCCGSPSSSESFLCSPVM